MAYAKAFPPPKSSLTGSFFDDCFVSASDSMYDSFVLQRRKRFDMNSSMKRILCASALAFSMAGCKQEVSENSQIPVKVLILPKFEIGEMSGDNFWKGVHDHENAVKIAETYGCPDPYAATEMEDAAIGQAVENFGMLTRYIIIRDIVNMDTYAPGVSPEILWSDSTDTNLSDDDSLEAVDLFETSMKNNFTVGKVIIDAILSKEAGF